jgi:hypothetical protein
MSLLVVCPVITPPKPGLLDSWTHRPHLVWVNGAAGVWTDVCDRHGLQSAGTGDNVGCMVPWNAGFCMARDTGHTHVAIMSQSLILDGGTTELATTVDRYADDRGLMIQRRFHCVVFAVELWERVGPFDESLPIWGDMDFVRRIYLAGELRTWFPRAPIGHRDERSAAVRAGAVDRSMYDTDKARYAAKWGGPWGRERYLRPWDPSSVSAAPTAASPTRGL